MHLPQLVGNGDSAKSGCKPATTGAQELIPTKTDSRLSKTRETSHDRFKQSNGHRPHR
jgi:hypothetical protein